MADEVFTIGSTGDYPNLREFVVDFNNDNIGSTGNRLCAEWIEDVGEVSPPPNISGSNTNQLCFRSSAGNKWIATVASTNCKMIHPFQDGYIVDIEDLRFNVNGRPQATTSGGVVYTNRAITLRVNRCEFYHLDSSSSNRRAGFIVQQGVKVSNYQINSCLFSDLRSVGTEACAAIRWREASGTVDISGCVIDDIRHDDSDAHGIFIESGNPTLTVNNIAITRIVATSGTATSISGTVIQNTNATFDLVGSITGIDETEYTDANNRDFTTTETSVLRDAGTKLGGSAQAITFDGFDRIADTSRDPWDIGAFEDVGPLIHKPTGIGNFSDSTAGDVVQQVVTSGTATFVSSTEGAVLQQLVTSGTGAFSDSTGGQVEETGVIVVSGTGTFSDSTDGSVVELLVTSGTGTFASSSDGQITSVRLASGTGTFTADTAGEAASLVFPTATGTFASESAGDVGTVLQIASGTGTFTAASFGVAAEQGVINTGGIGTFTSSTDGEAGVQMITETSGIGTFAAQTAGNVGIRTFPAGIGTFNASTNGAIFLPVSDVIPRRVCRVPRRDRLCEV